MLKFRIHTLQKCSKAIIERTACSKPTTPSSALPSFISLLAKSCKEMRDSKSVIWKRHRTKKAVLLDNLCNNNLIIFEISKIRMFAISFKILEHYNKFVMYITKGLEESDVTRTLGKDYADVIDDFNTWKNYFCPIVCNSFSIKCGNEEDLLSQLCFSQQSEVQPDLIHIGGDTGIPSIQTQCTPFDAKNPFLAPVTVNRELHKGGDRSCLHIELNIKGSKMHYEAGDHVAMYPINDEKLVEKLGKLCQADLDTVFSLINCNDDNKKHPSTYPTTYRFALTHYLEITAKPTTDILRELAKYCTDEADKEFLHSMTSTTTDSKKKYQSWIEDSCRNIVQVVEDIKTCKPHIEHICKLLPRLQPRYYSISSSSKLYPNSVHITAVIIKYKTATGRINKGVATAYLKEKQTSSSQVKVPIFIVKSKFHLPTNPEIPVIMVGSGTGLAPFRAFIQERQFLHDDGKIVGDTVLYFGCRKKNEDFIYKEELEDYVAKGTLTLKTAFSRDQEKKIYVTHLMDQDADLLWKIISENNGHFYICGDAKTIAVGVRNTLVKIFSNKGNMSKDDAVQYLKQMEAEKRYLADVWS